jgi:hypothetical protein
VEIEDRTGSTNLHSVQCWQNKYLYKSKESEVYFNNDHYLDQGYTNPGLQVARATKFFAVAPNVCGSSVWMLLQVALLVSRILSLRVDFRKIYSTLPLEDDNYRGGGGGGGGDGNMKIMKLSCLLEVLIIMCNIRAFTVLCFRLSHPCQR